MEEASKEAADREKRAAREREQLAARDSSKSEILAPPVVTFTRNAHPTKYRFGDKLLELAFSTARAFSVVVIIGCLLALFILVVLFAFTATRYRAVEANPISQPTQQEIKAMLDTIRSRVDSESPWSENGDSTIENTYSKTIGLLRKFGLAGSFRESQLLDDIMGILTDAEYSEFVAKLETFLEKQQSQDRQLALTWYCSRYLREKERYSSDLQADKVHNIAVSAALISLVWIAICTSLGLMAFIAFPLLIRIEANTRSANSAIATTPNKL